MPRHRILEVRGDNADGWLSVYDKTGSAEAFARHVLVEYGQFYKPSPVPRGKINIPSGSAVEEFVFNEQMLCIAICRKPKFLLFEEIRDA